MHVTRVELENIKSYASGDFAFERGTTAIVGENGAGKTTILEAVAWALFDTLDYSKDDFLRRGAKRGSVRVTFQSDLDERLYVVYRDTGTGYYVYDPELRVRLQQGRADVRKFLEMHLGIEPGTDLKALFRSAVGVPQGFFTTDFLRTPAERKAAFDRLLKVEEYRQSAERLRDTTNLINERMAEARGRISGAEAQLARYDELVAEHAAASERVEELARSLAMLRAEVETRSRAVAEFDEAERRVLDLRAAAERMGVERESAERRLRDSEREADVARRAAERQRACEADYKAHVEALDLLRAMESERAERERLRAEASDAARKVVAAEADARRLEEALERAQRARRSLAEMEPDVARQEELERERDRLLDLRAHAAAARDQLARLDRELEHLRKQHSETSRRVRATESLEGAQEKAERLESERMEAETRLSRVEQELTARKHLTSNRRELAREIERLGRSVVALEKESRELERSAALAARATELESRERELTRHAADLRAQIARDEKLRAEARNGLCPIMGERCTSFTEGRSVTVFFDDQIASSRAALAEVEEESSAVVASVRAAREAERSVARFEAVRARLASDRELLAERESSLAKLDEQLKEVAGASERLRDELQAEMIALDLSLKQAREEALQYAELEPLRVRLREIEAEGRAKKDAREELAATANAERSLEEDLKETERELRRLNDPRGRAAALREEAGSEAALREEERSVRAALALFESQAGEAESRLARFSDLDARWAAATEVRERTAGPYREYLESASLAATLAEREAAAREAEESARRARAAAESAKGEYERALAAYDRERHNAERAALELARQGAAATGAQAEGARERADSLAAELVRLDEVRESLREEFRAKERLQEIYEATDFIRDTLKKAGPLVTESYLYNISIEANQLFREITGEGGRSLKWSKDYEILLEEGGHERPFVSLSGGEQMAAALSVRLALLKQLSDIRIAFFDEPTVNMDVERRERLAQQLGQVRDFDQLFVISHDDAFEATVDHLVTVRRGGEAERAE